MNLPSIERYDTRIAEKCRERVGPVRRLDRGARRPHAAGPATIEEGLGLAARLVNLLADEHSQADATGRHTVVFEPYG
ncbi:hypothetical protein FVF58_00550 [Paraburkholderia panacisoli]|uniref:Uncharacterized protein n=1 Tax=Paraburkholderia panacisoli TaxID=2603818 RepID=A0A5B0HKW1_9BURK|nr:hypothetical protein [Paraburkholderia panacisoli]KAA1015877.1 hypothetical protein FVF58_00550 [Paraburkholderia panacisoli]